MTAVWEALTMTGWDDWFRQWQHPAFTDVVLARADKEADMTAERRSAIILGSMFACQTSELHRHLKDIDAPGWLRHDAAALAQHHDLDGWLDGRLRQIARQLGSVRLRDWLLCRFIITGPVFERAFSLGILDAAHPRLLTGDILIDLGLTPGPEFGRVLAIAERTQDIEGWTCVADALTWLKEQ